VKGRNPNPLGESLSGRQKRAFAVLGVLLLVVIAGVGVWAVRDAGSYGRSANGCVNVSTPSTTGAGLIHACGADAQALCRRAQPQHTQLAALIRAQCRAAGLMPGASPKPGSAS
jgi:hypothetical protein